MGASTAYHLVTVRWLVTPLFALTLTLGFENNESAPDFGLERPTGSPTLAATRDAPANTTVRWCTSFE